LLCLFLRWLCLYRARCDFASKASVFHPIFAFLHVFVPMAIHQAECPVRRLPDRDCDCHTRFSWAALLPPPIPDSWIFVVPQLCLASSDHLSPLRFLSSPLSSDELQFSGIFSTPTPLSPSTRSFSFFFQLEISGPVLLRENAAWKGGARFLEVSSVFFPPLFFSRPRCDFEVRTAGPDSRSSALEVSTQRCPCQFPPPDFSLFFYFLSVWRLKSSFDELAVTFLLPSASCGPLRIFFPPFRSWISRPVEMALRRASTSSLWSGSFCELSFNPERLPPLASRPALRPLLRRKQMPLFCELSRASTRKTAPGSR